jgi:hypothetical protein
MVGEIISGLYTVGEKMKSKSHSRYAPKPQSGFSLKSASSS